MFQPNSGGMPRCGSLHGSAPFGALISPPLRHWTTGSVCLLNCLQLHSPGILIPCEVQQMLSIPHAQLCRAATHADASGHVAGALAVTALPWVSPAEMAAQISFRNHTPAGFLHCISRYPVGCGFVQRMRQPAVWCASAGAPCPHQMGGGLARRLRGASAALEASTPIPRGARACEHATSNMYSLQEWVGTRGDTTR